MPAELTSKAKNRNWLWFFLTLFVLTIIAVSIQVWYNRGRQLTMQQLAAARQRWNEHNFQDYDLDYTVRRVNGTDEYQSQVRGGKVVSVVRNGRPIEERLFKYSSMPALFNFVEEFLLQDDQAQDKGVRRPYLFGEFHPQFGYLQRFVRSVHAQERVEITVNFRRAEAG